MQHLESELVLAVHRLLRSPPEVVPNHLNVVASRLWLWYVCPVFGCSERGPFNIGFRTMCWLFNVKKLLVLLHVHIHLDVDLTPPATFWNSTLALALAWCYCQWL